MAIQGIQVPMYTKHTLFLYFSDFSIIYLFFIFMKNKIKQNWKQSNKNMLNKAMHKTRLTQNKKAKHPSNAKTKTRKGEREKVTKSLGAFFLPHLGRTFLFCKPLIWRWGEELKLFKFERKIRDLRRSPRGAKEDGNWFWFPDEIMLLLCWVANHL